MRKTKKNKFDWYGLSQRFSIRKYHFGAASVLLGTAMMVSLATTVSANDLDTVVSTPSTTEIHDPLPMRTGLRKVTDGVYTNAIATINGLSNLNDVEKSYYIGEIAKQTKGIINHDKKVDELVAKAKAHNDLVAKNRGTSEEDAIESTVDPAASNSFSGTVKLKFGGAINDKTDTYTRPLAGVKVYAQWYEKNGYASPIYTTTTREDGSFGIGAADFIGADGKLYHFDADAALPSGEKWRIWSINPDTGKYSLLYSFGD